MMTYQRENIVRALQIAIEVQKNEEKLNGCLGGGSRSALLAGWETFLQELNEGKDVKIQ